MFRRPTSVTNLSNPFRTTGSNKHFGVDFAKSGTNPIAAAADGTVSRSYVSSSYGECIMIVHQIGGQVWETVYAHMRSGSRRVSVGERVKAGQTIGVMGNTGQSTGQHLHFELHRGRWNSAKSNAVNPIPYLDENQNQQSTSPSKPAKSYTIAAGDTLSAISQRYGVSVSAIAKANNIQNINQIYAGQRLIIPES